MLDCMASCMDGLWAHFQRHQRRNERNRAESGPKWGVNHLKRPRDRLKRRQNNLAKGSEGVDHHVITTSFCRRTAATGTVKGGVS